MKKICICISPQCRQNGSEALLSQAREICQNEAIEVESCGCLGGCQYGPNAEITNSSGQKEKQFTVLPYFLIQLIEKLKNN